MLVAEYQPRNREKARLPKLGRTWCGACDGALVGDGQKCPACGHRHPSPRAPARDARKA